MNEKVRLPRRRLGYYSHAFWSAPDLVPLVLSLETISGIQAGLEFLNLLPVPLPLKGWDTWFMWCWGLKPGLQPITKRYPQP